MRVDTVCRLVVEQCCVVLRRIDLQWLLSGY